MAVSLSQCPPISLCPNLAHPSRSLTSDSDAARPGARAGPVLLGACSRCPPASLDSTTMLVIAAAVWLTGAISCTMNVPTQGWPRVRRVLSACVRHITLVNDLRDVDEDRLHPRKPLPGRWPRASSTSRRDLARGRVDGCRDRLCAFCSGPLLGARLGVRLAWALIATMSYTLIWRHLSAA